MLIEGLLRDVTEEEVATFRYAGDDVPYRFHRSVPPQPHHYYGLKDGDRIDSDQFPVVWRAA